MRRFEYLVLTIAYDDLNNTLNTNGGNGWELTQMLEWGVSKCRLIMKRETTPPAAEHIPWAGPITEKNL